MANSKRWVATKVVKIEKAISRELYEKQIEGLTNVLYRFFASEAKNQSESNSMENVTNKSVLQIETKEAA